MPILVQDDEPASGEVEILGETAVRTLGRKPIRAGRDRIRCGSGPGPGSSAIKVQRARSAQRESGTKTKWGRRHGEFLSIGLGVSESGVPAVEVGESLFELG